MYSMTRTRARGPVPLRVGERIMQRRREIGLTQQQLGDRIGMTKVSVSRIEAGLQGVDEAKLRAFAAALDTSVAWLFSEVRKAG